MISIPLLDKVLLDFTEKSLLDNLCDRAHYLFTTVLLFYFAVLIAGKQTFGEPIRCMAPAEFKGSWVKFVDQYCFSTSTYVNATGGYEMDGSARVMNIGYYQWVPYVFLAQAFLFYAPHLLWTHLQTMADLNFEDVVRTAVAMRSEHDLKKRETMLKKMAAYFCNLLRLRERERGIAPGLGSLGCYSYIAAKLLSLANVTLQFLLVATFVGQGQLGWGFKLVIDALHGVYWNQGGFFPRVAYCEFPQLTDMALRQDRISQCALKLFAIIYFWFLVLALVTFFDAGWSLAHYIFGYGRMHFGKRYLKLMRYDTAQRLTTERDTRQFIWHTLGHDGLLLFHFIDNHAGSMVASEVACSFYNKLHTDPGGLRDEAELKDDTNSNGGKGKDD